MRTPGLKEVCIVKAEREHPGNADIINIRGDEVPEDLNTL